MKCNHLFFKSLCLVLGLTIAIGSFAQEKQHKTPEEKAQMMTDKFKTKLSLTEEQYQKVYAANLDFASKAAAIKQEAKTGDFKDKMESLEHEHHTALKAILTPDQLSKLEAMKNEKEEKMRKKDAAQKQ